MIVILHNIRSMHNVGSIFRTADAAGVEKIYLCGVTPTPIDKFGRQRRQIAKVSLGAEDYIQWEQVKSTTRLLDKLKKDGHLILAVEQSQKSIPYYEGSLTPSCHHEFISAPSCHPEFISGSHCGKMPKQVRRDGNTFVSSKIALVLGNEIRGLPPSVLNRADKILEIPMRGKKESLNVAVAFGIVVFHLANQLLN
jgi:tRNA G18 (ribose-2'-O)-methylase SpoU